jgi:hypothetical protein
VHCVRLAQNRVQWSGSVCGVECSASLPTRRGRRVSFYTASGSFNVRRKLFEGSLSLLVRMATRKTELRVLRSSYHLAHNVY